MEGGGHVLGNCYFYGLLSRQRSGVFVPQMICKPFLFRRNVVKCVLKYMESALGITLCDIFTVEIIPNIYIGGVNDKDFRYLRKYRKAKAELAWGCLPHAKRKCLNASHKFIRKDSIF